MPNINTKFTLSGEKEYKQAISEIGSGMKVLDAEMRKVTSAYGKNADSAKLLGKQNDILQRQVYSQTEKIRYMQEALKNSVEKTAPSHSWNPCAGGCRFTKTEEKSDDYFLFFDTA